MHDGRATCKTCPYVEVTDDIAPTGPPEPILRCHFAPPVLIGRYEGHPWNFKHPIVEPTDWCQNHPLFTPAKPAEPEPPKCRCGETAKAIPENAHTSFWWCGKCGIKIGQPFKRNPDGTVTHAHA